MPETDERGEKGSSRKVCVYACVWLILHIVRQKPTQYCKAIILQLKIKKLTKGILPGDLRIPSPPPKKNLDKDVLRPTVTH